MLLSNLIQFVGQVRLHARSAWQCLRFEFMGSIHPHDHILVAGYALNISNDTRKFLIKKDSINVLNGHCLYLIVIYCGNY